MAVALLFPSKIIRRGQEKEHAAPCGRHITAVHLTSIAINVYATHSAKEYRVAPTTKITVNGTPSQLGGLATGMSVVVTPSPDGVTAATIDAKTPKR